MACVGSVEEYWVQGFNGSSVFQWRVTGPDGSDVSDSIFTEIGQGDTIQVYWSEDFPGGIYTFEVVESSEFGCIGEPYSQNIMLNSPTINIPFDGVPESVAICFGEEAALDPGNFLSYLWQDESTNRIFYTGEAGTYQVQLVNSQYNCTYNEMEAFVNPLPVVWLGNDTVLFGTQTLPLDVYDPSFNFYEWSTGQISSSIVVDGGYGDQEIWVTVTDQNGCTNSDTIMIGSADYRDLRIPGAFTPNGDGVNDTWIFPAPGEDGAELFSYIDDVDVKIFNRWGNLVWSSSGMFKPWDGRDLGGRELPMDSYHYVIRFNVEGKVFLYKGSVTIVR
ncbi:MAG: hypothetical protein CVT98_04845 [Bacteroidetes bacterium HGW-Bacteroidetes-15]|nr:MAG: hypothetical protein CVT98_04845 [Bacteroidetes bacterium HGW-Bacteroidetes-15]